MRTRGCPQAILALSTGLLSCIGSLGADIGLVMSAPAGLLDDATSVELTVFPASGQACAADGSAGTLPADAQKFPLKESGCDAGIKWCGEVTLDQGDEPQLFHVAARGAAGVLGQGCKSVVIDQDPLEVSLKIIRFVEPACCGDGVLQVGELCDVSAAGAECAGTTTDAVCAGDCSTNQLPVDFEIGDPSPGPVGQDSPSLAFAGGAGQLAGGLRVVYQTDTTSNADVGVRYFTSEVSPVTVPASLARPHALMVRCSGSDVPVSRAQKTPRIAAFDGDSAIVAFRSNTLTALRDDAYVTILNDAGCNDMLNPEQLSDGTASVEAIDLAVGPGGRALVVWEQAGEIWGVDYAPTAGAGTAFLIGQGSEPSVAGGAGGWVAAYRGTTTADTDDGVLLHRIASDLTVGAPTLVNAQTSGVQDQADVAILDDGRHAVVWRSAGDVFLQRYAADDTATAADQESPLNTEQSGEQSAPTIEGDATGHYVAAWESPSAIRARYFDGDSGFSFNPVTGQNDDFAATTDAVDPRAPAIAFGVHVAIAWTDAGTAAPGVYVRRLPVPTD